MKKRSVRLLAAGLSAAMLLTQSLPGMVWGAPQEGAAGLTAFEQEFKNPTDKDAKPFMRWWIAPGRGMTEAGVRKEIENFAKGGYAGVELQCLELAKGCVINDAAWNETMKWILKAGRDFGVQIDFTVGQMWPVATPEITDVDDPRAEQQIWETSVDFAAKTGNMTYTADSLVLPATSRNGFTQDRAHPLIGVTAAKVKDGVYDPASVVDVLGDSAVQYNEETGAISWTAPSAGDWKVFYFYSQTANHTVQFISPNQYVIDHMSKEGTQAVIDNWEKAMNSDPELKKLYEENKGSIFGDSFELRSNLWTPDMLKEFKDRRGYDLTPYLPAINSSNDFGAVGTRVRDDLYATMTELLAENHMQALQSWAKTHNMTVRYQAYSSAGSSVFELTYPALNIDHIEAESYAMSGTVPDSYRQLSGVVHMKGDKIYSAEAAEIGQDHWRETWTDTQLKDGSDRRHMGFMYYANRLFAGGVNKMVFHGATYKMTDSEGLGAPQFGMVADFSWPGYSAMSLMSYGNEWDDKTPMWKNVNIMTDSLTRTGMVLQQGTADVDLAVYRSLHGKGNIRNTITDMERVGYTYDYVTPTVLNMDNATVGTQEGKTVLAVDGPSYKALIIEPMNDGTVPSMPVDTAKKIVAAAKGGLPVIIIGDMPSRANTYPGAAPLDVTGTAPDENEALAACLADLEGIANVKKVANRAEAVSALASLGVTPDAQPEKASNIYFQHRATDDAELYFIYNDGSEDSRQELTLKGKGTPYLLDSWSGEITPIVEYTSDGESVTMNIDLEAQDAMLVAVAQEGWSSKHVDRAAVTGGEAVFDASAETGMAVQATKGGNVMVEFADGAAQVMKVEAPEKTKKLANWKMILDQWTEGENIHDVKVVSSDTYDLSKTGLVPWYEIDEKLVKAAGVAKYTTSFDLAKGWEEGQGAYLEFTRVSDVGRLFVNDQEVPLNQLSLRTDIGKYVKAGSNTIRMEVSSNIANVKFGTRDNNTYAFGIIGDVTLTPYSYTKVVNNTKALENAKEEADAAKAEADKANADKVKAEEELKKAEEELKKAETAAAEAKKQAEEKAQAAANAQKATEQQLREAQAAADAAQKQLEAARAELKQAQQAVKEAQDKADKAAFQARKVTLSKLKSTKKKQMKVTWKKVSSAAGYQIQYATKSNFKGKKTLMVKGGGKTSTTIKKLKSNKNYYVRIRAYKKIGGKNVYTGYSAKKSVKVK